MTGPEKCAWVCHAAVKELTAIQGYRPKSWGQLSEGEQQAWEALVEAVLADKPFAGHDEPEQSMVIGIIKALFGARVSQAVSKVARTKPMGKASPPSGSDEAKG